MRTPLVAGNWKMNTTVEEAVGLVRDMVRGLDGIRGVDKVICPPFVSLAPIAPLLKSTTVRLGAQNMYFEEKGAYTGEISPLMLEGLCEFVILGHSERRQYFVELDEIVNKKVVSALKHHLKPIVCVGEKLAENESGMTETVISRQVRSALADVPPTDEVAVAYEPIWAIGTGKAATATEAAATIGLIRTLIGQLWGPGPAGAVRILYGGSVTAANITELLHEPEIDGALVGGASLKQADFLSIATQSAAARAVAR